MLFACIDLSEVEICCVIFFKFAFEIDKFRCVVHSVTNHIDSVISSFDNHVVLTTVKVFHFKTLSVLINDWHWELWTLNHVHSHTSSYSKLSSIIFAEYEKFIRTKKDSCIIFSTINLNDLHSFLVDERLNFWIQSWLQMILVRAISKSTVKTSSPSEQFSFLRDSNWMIHSCANTLDSYLIILKESNLFRNHMNFLIIMS